MGDTWYTGPTYFIMMKQSQMLKVGLLILVLLLLPVCHGKLICASGSAVAGGYVLAFGVCFIICSPSRISLFEVGSMSENSQCEL